jgi:hypothetical protein
VTRRIVGGAGAFYGSLGRIGLIDGGNAVMKFAMPAAIAAALLLAACAGDPADRGLGPSCASGLDAANRDLGAAKAAGLADSVNWGKAASLISAAKVQQQFSEYQNCVIKTKEARRLLAEIPRR